MPKTQKITITVTEDQLNALEDLVTFCEDVEYRNGQTLASGRAVVRRLMKALANGKTSKGGR